MVNKKIYIPNDSYVLVSQGIVIFWTFSKAIALKLASNSNDKWLTYKQDCIEKNEPYADNAVYVYQNGNLIANEWGEIV